MRRIDDDLPAICRGIPDGIEEQVTLTFEVSKQQNNWTAAPLLNRIDDFWHLMLNLLKYFNRNPLHA